MKRSIRLKEWGVSQVLTKSPSEKYSEVRDRCVVKDYRIQTNSQGFIVSGNGFDLDDAEGLLLFLGDSFVESVFVDEKFRFHSILEDRLWRLGRRMACYNGGYSGATSVHLLNVIVNKVLPLKPKAVFYVLPSNDAFSLGVDGGAWGASKVVSPFVPHESGYSGIGFTLVDIRSLIKSVHEVLAAFGIRVIFLTFPHRQDFDSDGFLRSRYNSLIRFSSVLKARRETNLVLRGYCKRRNVDLIDLEEVLGHFENYSQDDLHMDEAGSRFFADLLFSWIGSNEEYFE
ncbi:SGNH/GDSL hydrolase family protein [Pseudomonas sp. CC6-YY-74]|uniref:SGNH/GDSL hydrolase family protein n=1 Tax=Pseudomonas sp. CC6-YY-74 TaxID=1930532 RepID=UPI0009A20D98|nr:SGNH/GDSL hydrolase family protein [Pseudomonas sp. CC6-YY-74]